MNRRYRRHAACASILLLLLLSACASAVHAPDSAAFDGDGALLSRRLSEHGYTESQIQMLFSELRFFEITPLLVFDVQADLAPYIADCHAHRDVNSSGFFKLSGTYNTPFERAEPVPKALKATMLVNKNNYLSADYAPDDMQSVPDAYCLDDGDTYELCREALTSLLVWADAASEAGAGFILESATRPYSRQQEVYDYYLEKFDGDRAAVEKICARPGFSEHQTGYVVDLRSVDKTAENNLLYKDSKAFAFTKETCADYGWILRYPEGKELITGYSYEPWHYRYVGVELAQAVKESCLTYDEYYSLFLKP